MSMRLRDKFRLFGGVRVAAGALLPAVGLSFVLAGAMISEPAAESAIPSASSGGYEQAALGEASLRSAVPRAPRPADCLESHDACGSGAIPAAHAEPLLVLDLMRRAGYVTSRAPARVPIPDVAPHVTTSLSILFRNFRK